MRDIAKNIRQLRLQKDMTQDQLAEQLFVTRQTVSNYETGRSRPDVDMLVKIAEVLDADIRQVIYGPEPKRLKPEVIRLIAGGALTAVFAAAWAVLLPLGQEYQRMNFSLLITMPVYALVSPLCCLFGGWTAAQLLGMALGRKPPGGTRVRKAAIVLLVLVVLWFLLSSWYAAAFMLHEWQVLNRIGGEWYEVVNEATGGTAFGWRPLPVQAPQWLGSLVGLALRHRILYHALMLLTGALLWLLDVPRHRFNKL